MGEDTETNLPGGQFSVELPAGGALELESPAEVDMWERAKKGYIEDYGLHRTNDLIQLGSILTQTLIMYRAQRNLMDEEKAGAAQGRLIKASEEVRKLEAALGIDKKSREAGGQHTVTDYLDRLKRRAHLMGVRVAERVRDYEKFHMELRWKIRLLRNGDEEDRAHHGLTEESVIAWAQGQLDELEEKDRQWSKEQRKAVVVGRA